MFIAGLGVVAALAFVLGLGAVCLWALKRWGAGPLRARTRVPVEVVQRVPLGPKTGLAVVRVGEKVMALSVGDGGVRPLFELDEADRQRVIASSSIPMPLESSAEATAAFAPLSPTALGTKFGTMLGNTLKKEMGLASVASVPTASANFASAVNASAVPAVSVPVVRPFSLSEPAEVPRFLTAPPTTSRGDSATYAPADRNDRAFRNMLGVSLSGATRLAVLVGAMVLIAAPTLSAQAAGATTTQSAATLPVVQQPAAQPAAQPALQPPAAPKAPLVPPAAGRNNVRTATPARAAQTPAQTAAPSALRTGNGAAVANQGASSTRATNNMVTTPAAAPNGNAPTANTAPIAADDAIMRLMPQMDVKLGGEGAGEGLRLNGTVGIVVMMGLLTLLPTLILMMTGFTRILIVLNFLKQAMGTQTAPPGQLLAAMALLLTGFVMGPTLVEVNRTAITPWLDGQITQVDMMKEGVKPMRTFMLKQTRESDLKAFVEMSRMPRPATVDDVPLHVLMSAFVASELRTAFQIGFAIYLPFIIIDAVVASVLMSMGMFMLPPAMISLPFKLLLFVLVDGWSLTITSLVQSFK
ncbi:MAG: flagellar type III secretion system pore protein FliP [Gemmatimonadaceae bacterium]|nr:flagellar type III secretion system pore protein FliP [Gemmatimonadaceae bacterium]